MHPLVGSLESLKDSEIESKITELSKKYFMTQNVGVRNQIMAVLDTYNAEMSVRRANEWQRMQERRDKGLDKLININ